MITTTLLCVALAASPAAAPIVERHGIDRWLEMRSASGPSPSPDGSQVAFVTNITGVQQAWRVGAKGGWPHQVSFFPDRVRGVWWSPRGDLLAFAVDPSGKERVQLFVARPDGSGLRKLTTDDARIHHFGGWSPDGRTISLAANLRDEKFFDLHVVDVESGKMKLVKQEDKVLFPSEFSPDGRWLRYGSWRTNVDGDLYALELATGRTIHVNPHTEETRLFEAQWTADSRGMLLATDAGRDKLALARVMLDAPAKYEWVYEPKSGEVEGLAVHGKRIAALVNEDGYGKLHLLDGATGRFVSEVPTAGGVASSAEFAPDGGALYFGLSTPTRNGDVFRHDLATGVTQAITESDTGGIALDGMVDAELVKFQSHDGLSIAGFLYRPRGTKGPIPLVVSIHGGPEAQDRPSFNPIYQYLLSRGIGVYAPNIRGSTGYGKAFLGADNAEKRPAAILDVKTMVERLHAAGITRPGRVAVMGGSYGGYMTLVQIAFHPDLFCAAVDVVGIVNLQTFLERTDPWRRPLREAEYGRLDDPKLLWSLSAVSKLDQVKAPLFVLHGENDPRVPVHEARQVVEKLGARGVKVEALYFADEGHGLAKLPNRVKGYTAIAAFLERHLLGTPPAAAGKDR